MSSKGRSKTAASTSSKSNKFVQCCNSINCVLNCKEVLFCSDIGLSSSMDNTDYSSKKYWDQRYTDGTIEHEWYYSFDILEPIIAESREWESNSTVLEVGCGDRPLINGFLRLGPSPENLFGIDYAPSVIDLLKNQQKLSQFPAGINLEAMDGCNMRFESDSFDFICEKGTMDAILSDKNPTRGVKNSLKLISEIVRLMKPSSSFLLVSHIEVDSDEFDVLMNDIFMPSLATKPNVHWKIEAHVVSQQQNDEQPRKRQKKGTVTDDEPKGFGTVYLLKCFPRKMTRHSSETGDVSFEVKTYDE